MSLFEDEDIVRYAVRVHPRAQRDMDAEGVRLAEIQGDQVALDWLLELGTAIGKLATMPRRFALAPEEELVEHSVRVLLFRRSTRGAAWRVFFTVEEDTPDGRVVRVRHIRHASSPLTDQDTGELLTNG